MRSIEIFRIRVIEYFFLETRVPFKHFLHVTPHPEYFWPSIRIEIFRVKQGQHYFLRITNASGLVDTFKYLFSYVTKARIRKRLFRGRIRRHDGFLVLIEISFHRLAFYISRQIFYYISHFFNALILDCTRELR